MKLTLIPKFHTFKFLDHLNMAKKFILFLIFFFLSKTISADDEIQYANFPTMQRVETVIFPFWLYAFSVDFPEPLEISNAYNFLIS